jgi:hypothetical protein
MEAFVTTFVKRESRTPFLDGATEWLNSEPLTQADVNGGAVEERTVEITFHAGGVEAYVFTFG